MTYYGARELAESMRTVRNNTILIAEDIPEEKYSYRTAPGTRSAAEMLVHIAVVPQVEYQIHAVEHRTTLEGFDFFGLLERLQAEEQQPRSKAQIRDLLRQEGERWFGWVEGVSEEFLAERVAMPSEMGRASKSRFEMLLGVKELEALSKSELDALIDESLAYDEVLRKRGHYLVSDALQPVQMATTVRIRNGRLSITDGPFAETKKQLGGFILIDAKDLNDAIQVAAKIPPARLRSVEVRPIMELTRQ